MDPVLSRRSVREYTDQPVSEETVRTLLRAAMAAPSAEDQRPWHFVVIRDHEIRAKIPQVHRFAHMISRAPVALLICGDETRQKQRGFWVQDCAAATENILIEAQQLGLGAVWLGVYPVEGRVQGFRRLLNIPDHVVPFALVVVGYPAKRKKPVDRYDASRVHQDSWADPESDELNETLTHVPVSSAQTVEVISEQSQVDGFGDTASWFHKGG
jgi:nitroreductase